MKFGGISQVIGLVLLVVFSLLMLGHFSKNTSVMPITMSSSLPSSTPDSGMPVHEIIDGGNGAVETFDKSVTINTTVLELLTQTKSPLLKPDEFGKKIVAINNVKNGTNGKTWQYFINGVHKDTRPEQFMLKMNDTVEWKFE